jgi:(2R)-3-sulfolactate dehydrogenase (NADP+)
MVEILTAGLAGASFAFEASSFFSTEGAPPCVGQSFVIIDPVVFAGSRFSSRIEELFAAIVIQDGARLPGTQRQMRRVNSQRKGVAIPEALYQELVNRGKR